MSLTIFKITLGVLVLILGFFTIKGLKRSTSYQSDQYDHYLFLLIALESVVLPMWVFLT
ncbi:hypothetical protein CN373_16600 [Bacillus cereus]|uniref:Uncharacterized protein n=1 Tax=Bacillus cereus TaxID=1396 RepID=A0AA44TEC9_BACCE|nr:hypothetical protein CN373_16600 [Bacillus cereus]PFN06668.1 hypothetical protein COJ55_13655 [Bacillus cereus]PFO86008.1 hypothetical protein COJ77_00135 [Bacillus cereus]PFR26161.1 hypothetical protein COK19_13240 [Bacillus cereus]PFR96389.1 hypothetical protein COK38_20850 [Bacillus cereus]